jgi:carbamoyl-phosphate synthase large subunit
LPAQNISKRTLRTIKEYTVKLARELKVIGLLNIQYAVKDGRVYILEANPRASRTVPYVSKAIGVPLAKVASKVMMGKTLKELGLRGERKISHVAVKEAVFPFLKLPGVDPVLSPEMKSTGEVMGIDYDFGRAYYKSQVAAGNKLPTEGTVFISVRKRDHEKIRPIAKEFADLGFKIIATEGTLEALSKEGIEATVIKKISEGSPNILDLMMESAVSLIINTPTGGRSQTSDGYYIRRYAVDLGIPYITTTTAASMAAKAIRSIKEGVTTIRSINEYHKEKISELMLEDFE